MSHEEFQPTPEEQRREQALAPAKKRLLHSLEAEDYVKRRDAVIKLATLAKGRAQLKIMITAHLQPSPSFLNLHIGLVQDVEKSKNDPEYVEGEKIFALYKLRLGLAEPGVDELQREIHAADAIIDHARESRLN